MSERKHVAEPSQVRGTTDRRAVAEQSLSTAAEGDFTSLVTNPPTSDRVSTSLKLTREPWHNLEGDALDGFFAVTDVLFASPLWFTWCGTAHHIQNADGFLARHEAARIAVQCLIDLGWGPSMNSGSGVVSSASPSTGDRGE